jgi:oligosaccharide repeat unit polymerase
MGAVLGAGAPRFIELTFWIYIYVWAGLAPLAQMGLGQYPLSGVYGSTVEFTAALIAVVGVASWVIGHAQASAHSVGEQRRSISQQRVVALGLASIPISTLGISLIGISVLFGSREALSRSLEDVGGGEGAALGQLLLVLTVVPPTSALCLLLLGRGVPGWRYPLGTKLLMVVLLGLVVIVGNPISNARFVAGAIWLALFIAFVRPRTTNGFRLTGIALILMTLLVFPLADAFRYDDTGRDQVVRFDEELLTQGDYDAFQQTMNGLQLVSDEGHSFGRQILGGVLAGVPRQFWSGKPEASGIVIAEHVGYRFTNLSSPIFVEGYLDFGWIGVALVGGAFGFVAGRLDRLWMAGQRGPLAMLVPFLAGYQIIILRGSLQSVIQFLMVWILVTFLVSKRVETSGRSMLTSSGLGRGQRIKSVPL